MKIYLDVLFITELVINIMLVGASSAYLHIKVKASRSFWASAVGAIASLSVIAGSETVSVSIRLVAMALMSVIAFDARKPAAILKRCIVLFMSRLTFIALVYILWFITDCGRLYIISGTVYLDVSIPVLIISCCVSYALLCICEKIYTSHIYKNGAYILNMKIMGELYRFEALADTGNTARDIISGKPVIVCVSDNLFCRLKLDECLPKGFRLMPYSTVSGSSLMRLIKPQEAVIVDGKGNRKSVDATVGIVEGESEQAIFNPCLLR